MRTQSRRLLAACLVILVSDGVLAQSPITWQPPLTRRAGVQLTFNGDGSNYPITIDPIAQQAYLKGSNTNAADSFGISVAISGDTVVVGADAVNGDDGGNSVQASGAAYVFVRNGATWTQQAYLQASNLDPFDIFGGSVAISGDTLVIGSTGESSNATGVNGNQADNSARFAGAAYVFVRNGVTWTQQAYLKASNTDAGDVFGNRVAISGDTVVVATSAEASNATGINGNQADNSAPFAGAAYVFVRKGATWSQQAYLKASNTDAGDVFGGSVAVAGDTVIVGAAYESSNASGINGDQVNNSLPAAGAAYVFARTGVTWTQQAYLKASNNSTTAGAIFGQSVAISEDTVCVGAIGEDSDATGVNRDQGNNRAPQSGAAYVFVRDGATWTQQAYLKASNTDSEDNFGYTIAISGNTVAVGAFREDSNAVGIDGNQGDNSAPDAGAAYVFLRNGTGWTQQAYLKASNTDAGDIFSGDGNSVAISGDTVVVGADGEDSNATGINGNQGDNSAPNAGAAYVFTGLGPPPTPTPSAPALGNISTRLDVETGDNALIGGFIVTGTQPKKVIVRAIGPSLDLPGELENPTLTLFGPAGPIASNDNWIASPNKQEIIDTTIPPTNDLESAIVATLPANNSAYTAIVSGVKDTTGIALVEAYDLDRTVDSKLANVSTRGLVQTGDNVLIGGLIVVGTEPQKVIVRAIGPSLPVAGSLADPTLELYDGNGVLLAMNDDWRDTQEAEIIASTIPPTNDHESAIVATLPANNSAYTAIVRGFNGTTGIALVEVYALDTTAVGSEAVFANHD